MSKRTTKPTVSKHINLYEDDWAFLVTHYGPDSLTKYGPSALVRDLIHARIKALRAKLIEAIEQAPDHETQVDSRLIERLRAQGSEI